MAEQRLTHEQLQQAAGKQLLHYTFMQGQGGALVFLWTLGLVAFVLVLEEALYAIPWTIANAVFIGLVTRSYAKSRAVRDVLIKSVMERRYPASELGDPALKTALQNAIGLYAEIALKIGEIEHARGPEADLRQVLADTDSRLSLQFESSKQAEEFERALRIVQSYRSPGARESRSGSVRLQEENLAAIEKEAAERVLELLMPNRQARSG